MKKEAHSPSSQPEFCVKSDDHLERFGSAFQELLDKKLFLDVTLVCDGQELHCHGLVLAACSSYFKQLLKDYQFEHPFILLPDDIRIWQMKSLIDFMYKGKMIVSQDNLSALIKCSEILQIKGLCGIDATLNLQRATRGVFENYLGNINISLFDRARTLTTTELNEILTMRQKIRIQSSSPINQPQIDERLVEQTSTQVASSLLSSELGSIPSTSSLRAATATEISIAATQPATTPQKTVEASNIIQNDDSTSSSSSNSSSSSSKLMKSVENYIQSYKKNASFEAKSSLGKRMSNSSNDFNISAKTPKIVQSNNNDETADENKRLKIAKMNEFINQLISSRELVRRSEGDCSDDDEDKESNKNNSDNSQSGNNDNFENSNNSNTPIATITSSSSTSSSTTSSSTTSSSTTQSQSSRLRRISSPKPVQPRNRVEETEEIEELLDIYEEEVDEQIPRVALNDIFNDIMSDDSNQELDTEMERELLQEKNYEESRGEKLDDNKMMKDSKQELPDKSSAILKTSAESLTFEQQAKLQPALPENTVEEQLITTEKIIVPSTSTAAKSSTSSTAGEITTSVLPSLTLTTSATNAVLIDHDYEKNINKNDNKSNNDQGYYDDDYGDDDDRRIMNDYVLTTSDDDDDGNILNLSSGNCNINVEYDSKVFFDTNMEVIEIDDDEIALTEKPILSVKDNGIDKKDKPIPTVSYHHGKTFAKDKPVIISVDDDDDDKVSNNKKKNTVEKTKKICLISEPIIIDSSSDDELDNKKKAKLN